MFAIPANFECGINVTLFRPSEGVKIAATDEEAKADATGANQDTSGVMDIDIKCNQMLR